MAFDFNKIKNLFVVSEEDNQQKKEENKQPEKTETTEQKNQDDSKKTSVSWKINSQTTSEPVKQTTNEGNFNQQIFDSLAKALVNANLPGEDYLEFADALKAMKDIPLDEKIKIQTVLATLSTKGLTVQTVYDSADYYLKVLENEKTKFYDAMQNQIQGTIVKKQKDIENLEKQIKAKSEQIALLTQEITKNQEEISKVKNDINQADSKIKSTENSFIFTFDYITGQIKENVDKVKSVTTK